MTASLPPPRIHNSDSEAANAQAASSLGSHMVNYVRTGFNNLAKGPRLLLQALAYGMVLALVLSLASWIALQFFIVPRINDWRPFIERQTSQALGIQVRIGHISAQRQGFLPKISLHQLELIDAQGQVGLRLQQVDARLAGRALLPYFLLSGDIPLRYLNIQAPDLEIRRDRQGLLHIAGFPLSAPAQTPAPKTSRSSPLDWLFSQHHIQITNGTIRWKNEQQPHTDFTLQHIQLSLNNSFALTGRRHSIQLDVTPPATLGAPIKMQGSFHQPLISSRQPTANQTPQSEWPLFFNPAFWNLFQHPINQPGDLRSWTGTLDLELPAINLPALKQYLDVPLPVHVAQGSGSIQTSLAWVHGQVQSATATLHLNNVQLKLIPQQTELQLRRLDGQITAQFDGKHATIQAKNLSFATEQGWSWPQGDFKLRWQLPVSDSTHNRNWVLPPLQLDKTEQAELQIRRLDLASLAKLAPYLPLGEALQTLLKDYTLEGQLESFEGAWSAPPQKPLRYTLRGRLHAFGLNPEQQPSQHQPSADANPPAALATLNSGETLTQPLASTAAHTELKPSIKNADLVFQASETGGQAELAIQQGWLTLPHVLDQPTTTINHLATRLKWNINTTTGLPAKPRIDLQVVSGQLDNDDLKGSFKAHWHTGDPAQAGPGRGAYLPGNLQLLGLIESARAASIPYYLPRTIAPETRLYLHQAILDGLVRNIQIQIDGDLWDIPFGRGIPGQFLIRGQVEQATFDYAPAANKDRHWPPLTDLHGQLIFEQEQMRIEQAQAKLGTIGSGQFQVTDIEGHIPDLNANSILLIKGKGQGSLPDLLSFIQNSPLNPWLGHALAEAHGDGQAELDLGLGLKLSHIDTSTVNGSIKLNNNTFHITPLAPKLTQLQGNIQFTDRELHLQLNAQALGGAVRVEGHQTPKNPLHFSANTTLTVEGLHSYVSSIAQHIWSDIEDLSHLDSLSTYVNGQTSFQIELELPQGRPNWTVTSDLTGLALNLPAPLNKTAEQALPLSIKVSSGNTVSPSTSPSNANQLDTIQFDLGPLLQAIYVRNLAGPKPAILQGAIGIMQPAKLPASGVYASADIPTLDLDAWIKTFQPKEKKSATSSPPNPPTASAPLPPSAASPAAESSINYLPTTFNLKAGEIKLLDRSFTHIQLQTLKLADKAWRTQIQADQAQGQIELHSITLPANMIQTHHWQIQAQLKRLTIPRPQHTAANPATPAPATGTTVPTANAFSAHLAPALDIAIDDLQWHGIKLGQLEIRADYNTLATNHKPVWQLRQFNLNNSDAQLTAYGDWTSDPHAGPLSAAPLNDNHWQTTLNFNLNLKNGGNLLNRLGQARILRNGKGYLNGQLTWTGTPMQPDMRSLNGQMRLELEAGQFLRVEPGMAKLLGVFTLQSLPRRMLLDFRDLVQEGFSFDKVDGHFKVQQGIVSTRDLRTRSVPALILVEGQANLLQENQDLHVWIIPEINAGAASLAYAAINPIMGLGTLIAQYFLRKPVAAAATRELHITGPWSEPRIEEQTKPSPPPKPNDITKEPASEPNLAPAP